MKKYKYPRLNITLRKGEREYLERIARDYGFRSPSELAATWLRVLVAKVHGAEAKRRKMVLPDEEYIRNMFDELGEWEPKPEPGGTPRYRRTRKK